MRLSPNLLTWGLVGLCCPAMAQDRMPQTDTGEPIAILHAVGAQMYECRKSDLDTLTWVLREPAALLMRNGKSVGRHFAGPTWELADGSMVKAKLRSQPPASRPSDIPTLDLVVTESRGGDPIASAQSTRRINTAGGVAKGGCVGAGDVTAVPYSADYAFYGPKPID